MHRATHTIRSRERTGQCCCCCKAVSCDSPCVIRQGVGVAVRQTVRVAHPRKSHCEGQGVEGARGPIWALKTHTIVTRGSARRDAIGGTSERAGCG